MKWIETLLETLSAMPPLAHAGITTMAVVVAPSVGHDLGLPIPFFNVSITTLGMAAAGSMLGFAYGTPVKSRLRLYGYAVGGIFIGVWSVQILPPWLDWEWYVVEVMEPPVAGAAALISRWAIPLIVEHLPTLWGRLTNTSPQGGGDR